MQQNLSAPAAAATEFDMQQKLLQLLQQKLVCNRI
jgi:hypothetical protein